MTQHYDEWSAAATSGTYTPLSPERIAEMFLWTTQHGSANCWTGTTGAAATGEVVLTPFMGVGSEVYGAVRNGRRGIGVELKPSYYQQAVKNLSSIGEDGVDSRVSETPLLPGLDHGEAEEAPLSDSRASGGEAWPVLATQ